MAEPGSEAALALAIARALSRLRADLRAAVPAIADDIQAWQVALAGSAEPADYFTHIDGFPLLRLPWWMYHGARRAEVDPDPSFLDDLIHSTVCGYYYIRLIDNVMDGHAEVERGLLPALGLFHSRFQGGYRRWFSHDHPFWDRFQRAWDRSVEVTILDGRLADVSWRDFVSLSGRKTGAATIPLAAVACRLGIEDRFQPWSAWVSDFGLWHQLCNDFFDWNKDLRLGTATYVLSEARRRAGPDADLSDWMVREGFGWAYGLLLPMLDRLGREAETIDRTFLPDYVRTRRRKLEEDRQGIGPVFGAIGALSAAFRSTAPASVGPAA